VRSLIGAAHVRVASNTSLARIPAAAVTVEDAELLHRLTRSGRVVSLKLRIVGDDGYDGNGVLRTSVSYNVMGEVTGTQSPHEVVVLGGHIDSWDVGQVCVYTCCCVALKCDVCV
jgi:carboxypeptidase Q